MEERLLSPRSVAQVCDVKVSTVWAWIRTGKLPAVKIGRNYRVPESELHRFIHGGK